MGYFDQAVQGYANADERLRQSANPLANDLSSLLGGTVVGLFKGGIGGALKAGAKFMGLGGGGSGDGGGGMAGGYDPSASSWNGD